VCLFFTCFVLCSMWFQLYFQIITDVIFVHTWILECIFVMGVYFLMFLVSYYCKL